MAASKIDHPYPSSVLVNTAAFHKSKLLQHWSHSASLTSSDWGWNYWNWLHVLVICSFSVGLGGVKGIIIHNFPDFLLQDGNNFCWHKQVCLIQILYNKLFPQNYFLIQVKKKLLHCRITTKKCKIQLMSSPIDQASNMYSKTVKKILVFILRDDLQCSLESSLPVHAPFLNSSW